MIRSRLRNYQDKKERRQIILTLGGIGAIVIFFAVFGVKLLVGFSLLVDRIRGNTPTSQQQTKDILIPPQLDSLPTATFSGQIKVTGKVKGNVNILLYVNEVQSEKTTSEDDGTFLFPDVSVKEGTNVISAKTSDDKNTMSELSNVLTILVKKSKPTLDITEPQDNAEISGDKQSTNIIGKTESDNTVTINDRFAVVQSDGTFTYKLALQEGEQPLIIIAKDVAGNETKLERKIRYRR